jgi:hypothetical protein
MEEKTGPGKRKEKGKLKACIYFFVCLIPAMEMPSIAQSIVLLDHRCYYLGLDDYARFNVISTSVVFRENVHVKSRTRSHRPA